MQDKEVTSGKSNNTEKANKNPLSAAYARFKLLPITWRVVSGALLGVAFLGALALFLPNMKERMKFFTDAALSWLIFVIVAVQAYIYGKQWKVMDKQVVFGLRAHVGVHGVSDIDFTEKRFLIKVGNIGKVPASHIDIKYVMEARIPEKWIPDEHTRRPPWKTIGNNQVCHWPNSRYYGRAKLDPGPLKIEIPVMLNSWLNSKQVTLIAQGHAEILLKGNIEFSDGFNSGKNTPFAFRYSQKDRAWIVDAVITKEEVEALLAERTKKYFGEKGPQFGSIIESYTFDPPREPAKTEDKKG